MRDRPLSWVAVSFPPGICYFVKQPDSANALHNYLQKARPLPWVELEPHRRRGKSKPAGERNARWNVIEHRKPELDELIPTMNIVAYRLPSLP